MGEVPSALTMTATRSTAASWIVFIMLWMWQGGGVQGEGRGELAVVIIHCYSNE